MEQEFNFPRGSSEALELVKKFLKNRFTKMGEVSDWAAAGEGYFFRGGGIAREEGTITVNGQGRKP